MPFRIVRRTLVLPGWVGTASVAHITDLHFGWVTPTSRLERAVQTVNALRPDLCVLTGDFVGRGPRFLPVLTRTLGRLQVRSLAVLGNHDHFVGGSRVTAALAAAGIEVIANGWTEVALPGGVLPVACMDDGTTGHDDPDQTVAGLAGPALGLTHNPSSAPALWQRGVPLVLCGHTHGGQVNVPRITAPLHRALGQPWLAGLHDGDGGRVYVNAGLGSSAFPWRVGVPARAEVALLTLTGTA